MGRVYAQVDGELNFSNWVDAIGKGRSYVSDGTAHIMDYSIKDESGVVVAKMGVDGSEVQLHGPQQIVVSVRAAVRRQSDEKVPVEVIVNGYPVAQVMIDGDGALESIEIPVKIERSSWIAVRCLDRAHTNPIYVVVNDQPVRGSILSAQWCLMGVEQCWRAKKPTYSLDEQAEAQSAYEHAMAVYREILREGVDASLSGELVRED
jgi:hypothetical protein